MRNALKEKLEQKARPVGTFVTTDSVDVVECLACTGLDYVILDNEHSPMDTETTCAMVRAASGRGLTALARVREISRSAVLKLLDVGAQGLIIPNVHGVEDMRRVVDYAKYAPVGQRGFGLSRKDGWGSEGLGTVPEIMAHFNRETLVVPQCETAEALDSIEDIAAMEGVDGVFIGPYDLSISMGIPGAFDDPRFAAALQRVVNACHQAGKFCLIFAGDGETGLARLEQGFDGVAVGVDATLLMSGVQAQLAKIKK